MEAFDNKYQVNNTKQFSLEEIADKFRDGIITKEESKSIITNFMNTILAVPLRNSLTHLGDGSGYFERTQSNLSSYINRYNTLSYVDSNEPRINKNGLLMEGSSKNHVLYSNITSSINVGTNTTVTPNAEVSPDKTTNATMITGDGSSYVVGRNTSILNNTLEYTFSLWLKADVDTTIRIAIEGSGSQYTIYNEKTINVGTEWKLYSITGTNDNDNSELRPLLIDMVSGRTYYTFGWQLEEGSIATSLIPTNGTQETRGMDIFSIDAYNNFPLSESEFTVTLDYTPLNTNNLNKKKPLFSVDGSSLDLYVNSNNNITYFYGTLYETVENINSQRITLSKNKGLTAETNILVNNVSVGKNTSTLSQNELPTMINIGNDNTRSCYGYIKNIRVFDRYFSDTVLNFI